MSWLMPKVATPVVKQRVDAAFENLSKAMDANLEASKSICYAAKKLETVQATLVDKLQSPCALAPNQSSNTKVVVDLFCTADSSFFFVELKPEWEEVLGWTLDELREHPFLYFVHPDDAERTRLEAKRLLDDHLEMVDFRNRYKHKNGNWITLSWVARAKDGIFYAVARPIPEADSGQHAKVTDVGDSHQLS